MSTVLSSVVKTAPNRQDVEEFLFREAALLDAWKLNEWLALFTDDALYQVPTTDLPRDASPDTSLFFIADDRFRLSERVLRLGKRGAHAEFPHSRTRHMVTNVLIDERIGDELIVNSAFAVHRFKAGTADLYVGSYRHRLVVSDSGLLIREKRCILDTDVLRPQGRISILL
jgi:p-cumate 2,3-dioxygenase subunit beta